MPNKIEEAVVVEFVPAERIPYRPPTQQSEERAPYRPIIQQAAQPVVEEGLTPTDVDLSCPISSMPFLASIFGLLSWLCGLMTIILFFVLFAGAGPSMFKLIAVVNAVLGCAGCAAVSAGLRAVYEIHAKVTAKDA